MSFTSRPNGGDPNRSPQLQLRVVERGGVALDDGPDRRVLGPVGLDDRRPRPVAAPRPPDRLGEQLVRPLRGPLVGQVERDVGRHDADERDLRDVEALGDEARPDEHVELGRPRTRRGRAPPRPRRSTMSRSSRPDPQLREPLPDLALDALRAAAEVADPRRAAGRAARRERRRPAAVVAAQRRAGLVVDERPLAVRARLDVAAVPAQDHRRGPAAVEDEDRPVAGARVERGERGGQRARQQAAVARGELGPQVDGRRRAGSVAGGAHGQDDPR